MRITIVGGGNIGTQFAVHCAEKGHEVRVFTSKPDLFEKRLSIVDEEGRTTHEGDIQCATANPALAFGNAEVIIVTLPSNMMRGIADTIFANTDSRAMIGVVPGSGGSECAFRRCIERGNVFFGIERVPAIARLVRKGKTVKSTGYRSELHVAAVPRDSAGACADLIGGIFDIPCAAIPTYLNLTLTPSNPILHTTRLRTIFSGWEEGRVYQRVPLFYEEWDDASSELLFKCDAEVQSICKAMPEFELQYVKSLREHYESPTPEALTRKIRSIPAFKGLATPTASAGGGLIPDLHSRYFTADFSYGLTIIQQVGNLAGVSTPNIDGTMAWYKAIALENEEFRFEDYGITNRAEFSSFYCR